MTKKSAAQFLRDLGNDSIRQLKKSVRATKKKLTGRDDATRGRILRKTVRDIVALHPKNISYHKLKKAYGPSLVRLERKASRELK